ncbi:hypothetical protein [Fuerstiella marisgermanici]|uniref:hypothetical protein n=1 Tax=Fuerstiella marisgermanici TaxID=1891926 RepID=UPI0011AB80E4|nr:hypothetical protein [Fuerstiella marisgermanici]
MAENIRRIRRVKYKSIRLDVHCHLRKQFRQLDINLEQALEDLAHLDSFEVVKIPALQVANKDFRFSVCRYGRIHTDLTNCHSLIRSSLTVNGDHLVSIDIKNSQPLFLSLLLINYRRSGNRILPIKRFQDSSSNPYAGLDELIRKTVHPIILNTNNPQSPAVLLSNTTVQTVQGVSQDIAADEFRTTGGCPKARAVNNALLSNDEQWFVELCEQGRLYEQLMETAEIPVRSWAKEAMFEILYGKNTLRTPAKSCFTEMFPKVAEVVRVHKRKDHRFLARLLQNVESDFVINTVCRRLMMERPEIPVFTIHDSIMTTPEHVEYVNRVFQDEFGDLGITPKLQFTNYSRSNNHDK